MPLRFLRPLPLLGLLLISDAWAADADVLWYREPAKVWTQALPVGNGRLGAMVFGGTTSERIQFNDADVWTGKPHAYDHPGAAAALPDIRALLFAGKRKEAEELAGKTFMSQPLHQASYQPTGDCLIDLPASGTVTDFRRWLDLDAGVAVTTYRDGATTIRREVRASAPDGLLLITVSSEPAGKLTGTIRLTSPHKEAATTVVDGDLLLRGQVEADGVRFAARLDARTVDGTQAVAASGITITGATRISLRLATGTNVASWQQLDGDPAARCAATIATAAGRDDAALIARQTADHQALYRRSTLDLGRTPAADAPTDERIAAYATGNDPDLPALLYRYGRYLLLSCSRPGGQVATLQGLWNQDLKPAWGSKMTCNINTEMNYWPAEVTSLGDCTEPMFSAIGELAQAGAKTAAVHYGAKGWVLHHNFDRWRGTAPINASNHGIWQTGGAWMSWHLWEHWQFTRDRADLAKHYPLMREAAAFFEDALVPDPTTGALISGPSNSPEQGGLVMGPTMDHQIIRCLFRACAGAAKALGVDPDRQARWLDLAAKIAPNKIGKHGQLQEWIPDVDDPANHHRHCSHLWGVFPGDDITARTPELLAAARKSLEFRGDEATGWSMGWKVNLWARFGDGDHALKLLGGLLRPANKPGGGDRSGVYPNLFDAHPPFQIDGNFGATAGIVEMLVQSHLNDDAGRPIIDLLPALPAAWPAGNVTGLGVRGAATLDLAWAKGQVQKAVLTARQATDLVVRRGGSTGTTTPVHLAAGEAWTWSAP